LREAGPIYNRGAVVLARAGTQSCMTISKARVFPKESWENPVGPGKPAILSCGRWAQTFGPTKPVEVRHILPRQVLAATAVGQYYKDRLRRGGHPLELSALNKGAQRSPPLPVCPVIQMGRAADSNMVPVRGTGVRQARRGGSRRASYTKTRPGPARKTECGVHLLGKPITAAHVQGDSKLPGDKLDSLLRGSIGDARCAGRSRPAVRPPGDLQGHGE